MAISTWAASASENAQQIKDNEYLRRIAEDPKVRENARVAYESARDAFQRISEADNPAAAILEDAKVRKSIRKASEAAIEARDRVVAPRRSHVARNLLILTAGAALVVVVGVTMRDKILDLVFGAEEEFDYVPTTAPPMSTATAGAPQTESPAAAASVNGDGSATAEAAAESD